MSVEESYLKDVLAKHAAWVAGVAGGVQADLSWSYLPGVNLSGANLRGADLSDADLQGADLSAANLSGAKLRNANLEGAYMGVTNLSGAHLDRANLRGAYLRMADLRGANFALADLSEADLHRAEMEGANLKRAKLRGVEFGAQDLAGAAGPIATGYLGRHPAVAAGGYIVIGCERHKFETWLDHGEEIGKENGYSDAEIERYMTWIKIVVKWLGGEGER